MEAEGDTAARPLREWLAGRSPGPFSDPADLDTLVSLLMGCWPAVDCGGSDSRMAWWKLGRIEAAEWDPPKVNFEVERHGGVVLGSIYADIQGWTVNVDTLEANHGVIGRRRIAPAQPRLDVKPIAQQLTRLIVDGAADPRLKWQKSGARVRVLIAEVIPDEGPRETIAGQRKRLRKAILAELPSSWREVSANVYERTRPSHADEPKEPRGGR
jgi:hypothetical protein